MAQLLCIGTVRHQKGVQEAGDIVGVFEDSHEFGAEIGQFDIVSIKGWTKAEMLKELAKRAAEIDYAKKLWLDGDTWRELKEEPKFRHSIKEWTEIDKTAAASDSILVNSEVADKITDRIEELSINQTAAEVAK